MRSVRGATVSQAVPRRLLPNHDMLSTEVTESSTVGWHITYEIDDARITRLDSREITMPDDGPAPDASPGVKRSLRKIYTYGGRSAKRNLTIAEIQANKAARVKMTQVSAQTREEAEMLEALGIDLVTIADLDIDEIRAGAPNTFVTGSQTMVQYVTEDEALAAAIRVAGTIWLARVRRRIHRHAERRVRALGQRVRSLARLAAHPGSAGRPRVRGASLHASDMTVSDKIRYGSSRGRDERSLASR